MKPYALQKLFQKTLLALIFCFATFTVLAQEKKVSVTAVTWNVQTFFDANCIGTEYSDFIKCAAWNQDAYKKRLLLLCQNLAKINADIFILEEIENRDVIQDIANQMAGKSWNSKENWTYACFSKNPGDALGCAVLSKFPVKSVKNHNCDIRTEESSQPSMRPIMEVELEAHGKPIVLLVNHWKSKYGGQEKSEAWRTWQESVLAGLFAANEEYAVIAAGDFNRDITEFSLQKTTGTAQSPLLQNVALKKADGSVQNVHSPWLNLDGSFVSPGSYWYNSSWERIDHFFSNEHAKITSFTPLTDGEWCDDDGVPLRFKIYSLSGYSDHLPIFCKIQF